MIPKFDYTRRARNVAYRFPVLSFLAIQINFWIAAMFLYSTIIHLNTLYLSETYSITFPAPFTIIIINSLFIGTVFGIILGISDLLIDRIGIKRLSVGMIILIRILAYPIVILITLGLTRYIFAEWINSYFNYIYTDLIESDITWKYLFWSLLVYSACMAGVISFINQMNNKFGPGVLIPWILGNFREPKQQDRFFMFLDLKSSATHAENLGHLRYSSMIRDCFLDLNHVLTRNNAEIYQYVGDEAVITWPMDVGIKNMTCLSLFFDFQTELSRKKPYYLKNYGIIPIFKAGMHCGIVTAVEVGQIKREIAYHGDTINTASRIQGLCNQLNAGFLISNSVKSILPEIKSEYDVESLSTMALKGKSQTIELFGVQRNGVG